MMAPLQIAPQERGGVRLFAWAPDPATLARVTRDGDRALLGTVLGNAALDPGAVDIVRLADLGDLGLDGYLTEGYDVPDAAMADVLPQLRGLDGHVLIILSAALPQGGVLAPQAQARFVAAFRQADPDPARLWAAAPAPDEAAPPAARQLRAPSLAGGVPAGRMVALACGVFLLGCVLLWLL